MLYFLLGVVSGIGGIFLYVVLLDLINRRQDKAISKFNEKIIEQWALAHEDAQDRNRLLEAIRDEIGGCHA